MRLKKVTTILAGLVLLGVLTACGDNSNEEAEGTNNNVNNNEEEFVLEEYEEKYGEGFGIEDLTEEEQLSLTEEDELEIVEKQEEIHGDPDEGITEDPQELLGKDSDMESLMVEEDSGALYFFEIENYYTSEESDDNAVTDINVLDGGEGSFDYEFSLMYATDENEDGEEVPYLLFVGEVENNTDKRMQFNHDFDVIMRDIKEDNTYGSIDLEEGIVGPYEPEFEGEGWYAFEIDSNEKPKELEFSFETAWEEDDDGSGDYEGYEDYYDIDFTLDDDRVGDDSEDDSNNNEEESEESDSNNNEESEEIESEDDSEGLTVENIKEGMGEDTTIHDLYVEDLRRLSDDELRELMSDGEIETFNKGEQVYAETAGEDIFMGFGTSEVDDEELNLTVEDGETVEIEGEVMEPTPYIEELKEKYGEDVTMDELTDEERNRLDMYESTYLMELEDSR